MRKRVRLSATTSTTIQKKKTVFLRQAIAKETANTVFQNLFAPSISINLFQSYKFDFS